MRETIQNNTEKQFHAVSLSGGKDSTAMLLLMIERGMPIDMVLSADTGMEFPEMYEHLAKLDDHLCRERGLHITTLRHPKGFEYCMFDEPKQKPKSLENRARLGIPPYGNGWPGIRVRWCTGQLKTHLISKEVNRLNGTVVEVIGTDGDWIKILLPERVGYVHGKYLTISSTEKKPTDTGETTTPEPTEPSTVQGEPFSEDSDISTRDLLYDKETNKQFITVQDRDGNTFYIIIDYDSPVGEEEEQYKTYFLNPVDLADMEGLAEDGGETETPTCVCANKCAAGSVNTGCEVCAVNMTECMGKEPEPEVPDEPTEPVEEPEEKGGMGGIIAFVLIAALGGGAAFYLPNDAVLSSHRPERTMVQAPESHLKAAEMSMEDDYGMIDGIINNGKAADHDRKENKPSVLEQLRNQPVQERTHKTAPKKSAEKDDICFAEKADIPAWMNLMRLVIDGYPVMNENDYLNAITKSIDEKRAIVLKDDNILVGAMAFSDCSGCIDFLGINPQYRKQGIQKLFLDALMEIYLPGQEISMTTYREGDKADTGHRDILKQLGFAERELLIEFGYPTQRFVLPPKQTEDIQE